MVEVSAKADTLREAVARGFVCLSKEVLDQIKKGYLKKGNVLEVARISEVKKDLQ